MITCSQLSVGMVIRLDNKLYKVEAVSKVSISSDKAFMRVQLCDLQTYETSDRKLKLDLEVQEVTLNHSDIEFLYPQDRGYAFLDINTLDILIVDKAVIGEKINYLKEGIQVGASSYGGEVYAIELPQFLELMISHVLEDEGQDSSNGEQMVVLETGAPVSVPLFIEEGDVIKVDTRTEEFVQRV